MTKMEMTKRIETINTQEMFIMMGNRITWEDRKILNEIRNERKILEEKLN